jgi:hypothetical protein
LTEPDGGPAASIDQELLIARLNERAWAESIRTGNWRPRPEECHAEIARSGH